MSGWSQSLDKLSIKSRLKLGLSSPENGNDVNIIIQYNNLITQLEVTHASILDRSQVCCLVLGR